jgi:RNA polymerase sigma-70 factor (ECF subfamily)
MVQQPVQSSTRLALVPREQQLAEEQLVERCRAGDPQALRMLFERERRYVHRLLYRVVGSNTHMDDLLQDTFMEVFRSLPSFRGESSLRTWIHRCAVRVAYAHFKNNARVPHLEPVDDLGPGPATPEERSSRRQAIRRLYAVLDRLEPRQRMAFTLFAIEGRSLRQIAEIMESSLATAKIRTWRARRALEKRAQKDPLLSEFLADETGNDEESEQ